jgi:hypothetical protein
MSGEVKAMADMDLAELRAELDGLHQDRRIAQQSDSFAKVQRETAAIDRLIDKCKALIAALEAGR